MEKIIEINQAKSIHVGAKFVTYRSKDNFSDYIAFRGTKSSILITKLIKATKIVGSLQDCIQIESELNLDNIKLTLYEKEALPSIKLLHSFCLDKFGDRLDQIHFEANLEQESESNLGLDVALNLQI